MRWGRVIAVLAIIGFLVWGGYNCLGNFGLMTRPERVNLGNPEATVRSAIMSYESMKPEYTARHFTPIPGSIMQYRLANNWQYIDKIDIENLSVMIVLNEGVAARVQAVWDMVMTQNGYIETVRRAETLKLVRLEDDWYINEDY
jgi:hypothetical protein